MDGEGVMFVVGAVGVSQTGEGNPKKLVRIRHRPLHNFLVLFHTNIGFDVTVKPRHDILFNSVALRRMCSK